MGQIRGKKAKVSACNIRSLSSFGIPYAGMHILVSTDNSATEDGQGNFDAYVVGDGHTAATALELKKVVDDTLVNQLNHQVNGEYIVQELPTSSWKTETWGTNWGSNNDKIYFDTRNIIDADHRITKFSICKNTNNGTMRVYFIKTSDYTIVTYKDVTLTGGAGVVSFDMTLEDVYYEAGAMYVGIHSTFTWGSKSGITDITTTKELVISTGVVNNVTTRLWGYGITVISQVSTGLIGEVDALKEQMGTVENIVLPSASWIEGSFPTGGGGGDTNFVLYDSRCRVSAIKKLKKVYADIRNGGTLRIYLLSLSEQVVAYKEVTAVQGWNEIPITFDDDYYTQDMYVGICTGSGIYIYLRSNSGANTSFRRILDTQETVTMSYDIGYGIEVADASELLPNRVDSVTTSPSETLADILAKGQNDIVLGPYDYAVTTPITLTSGMTIRGSFGKTRLILTDGCTTAITASNANDIKISDLEIVGTCPTYSYEMNGIVEGTGYNLVETEANALALDYMGTEKGIYLYYCENVVLDNIKINHINGSAIRVNHTGMDYIKGLNACNLFITNCYNGIYCENEHEFSQYTNFSVTLCMIGIYVASGNLIFTGGHVTRCRVAMQFVAGTNHAHGIVNGVELKHNQIAGLLCSGVEYGEFFEGLYLSYGKLIIRNSTGLYFDDIKVGNMSIDATGSTGVNKIGKLVKRNSIITLTNTDTLTILETVQLY